MGLAAIEHDVSLPRWQPPKLGDHRFDDETPPGSRRAATFRKHATWSAWVPGNDQLGDELRLRIRHVLAESELTASEIADHLGVERTCLYHYLGILRSASLLSIHDDGIHGWRYARRSEGGQDVGPTLTDYLESSG